MQSKEVMKKLADNYETLVFVSKRYPSSMSRLKNLFQFLPSAIFDSKYIVKRKILKKYATFFAISFF